MSTPSNQSSPTHSLTTTTTHPHHNASSSSNNINNNNNTTLVTTFLTPPSSTPSNFNISRKQHNLYTSKKALTLINNTPLIKVPYIEIYLKQASHIYERVSSSSSSTTTIHSTSSNNSETNHNNSSISPSQQQHSHHHHHHSTTNVQSSSSQSSQQQQQQHTPPPSSPNTYIVFICSIPIQTLSEFDSTNYTSSGSSNIRGYNRRVLKSNAIRMAHPVWNELFIFDIHVSNEKNLNNLQQQKHHSFGGHQTSLSSSSSSLQLDSSSSPQQQQQRIIHETILMQVWAKHIFKTDELLGTKTISLQSLVRNRENQMTLHVAGMSHAQCQIDLSIIIHDSLDSQMNVNQIGNEMGDTTTTILTHPTLYGSGGTTLWSHSGTSASGGGTMTTTTTSMNSPGGSSSSSTTTTFDFFDPFPSSTSLLQHLIIPDHTLIQNGRYRILQYISNQASKGGDSMIYKIVDHKQNNRIKILKKIKCETIQNANDAIRESWPLSELKHSNLIPYEDMFIDITTNDVLGSIFFVCYVTPFYEEGSLYDFMVKVKKKNIYLTLRRVSDYALQIAQGMEFLHSHSIMHRNLKPSNIYLVENNTVLKIGDFGFSKSISHSATILGGVTKIANFGYTAPEIALVTEVTTVYRFEVDIWSFGIILYELLTLKIDKEQLNHCALASFQYDSYIKNVIEGEIRKIYRNDADDFIQLLKRILVLDPSQRMSAKEIVLELKTLVEKFATNSNK